MNQSLQLGLALSVVGYLLCKVLNFPPIYPVIFLVLLAIELIQKPNQRFFWPFIAVFIAFIYLWVTSGVPFVRWQFAAALAVMPVMYAWFMSTKFRFSEVIRVIVSFNCIFLVLILSGISLRFSELMNLLPGIFNLDHWTRGSSDFRYFMVAILVPWSGDIFLGTVFRTFIELLTLWSALFLFMSGQKPTKGLVLTFLGLIGYCIVASSRGAIVIAAILAFAVLLDNWPQVRRWMLLGFVPMPILLSLIDSAALSGRSVMYKGARSNLGIFGHGLGSSGDLAEKLSKGERSQLHNIFLEISYDWGLIFFTFLCLASVWLLVSKRAYRTAVVVFVGGSLGYTVYSPWYIWTIYFAWLIDQHQSSRSLSS